MDTFGSPRNHQLFVLLAQRICSLVIHLINHARQECSPIQEAFRQALLPMHRELTQFLFPHSHSFEHSFQLRNPGSSFHTLPSMPHYHFHPTSQHSTTTGRFADFRGSITPPEDITPPHHTPTGSVLGFTSTPIRSPVVRPRSEPFALINQLLMAMHTSDGCNLSSVTDQYTNDPVFRERMLREVDELRSLILTQSECPSSVAGQALRTLLDRVEQAELTLSLLIRNIELLQNNP
ncbi:uncharacterized protein LOC128712954 [Anopheles marshallii]|uniref:uncharacterized protein LOC128712954 n=1 Tax=Anopheles marshallii TaxID=1521116 RepID=UPI00237BF27B|nr:uncharacterized protein LOC128712954 [Anopheles marshallii]